MLYDFCNKKIIIFIKNNKAIKADIAVLILIIKNNKAIKAIIAI
jgi:hypothetical protein